MGTLFGFIVGYVLGARAGNPGYERVQQAWAELKDSREFRAFVTAMRTHLQGSLQTASDKLGQSADGGSTLMASGEELMARARARIEGLSTDPG